MFLMISMVHSLILTQRNMRIRYYFQLVIAKYYILVYCEILAKVFIRQAIQNLKQESKQRERVAILHLNMDQLTALTILDLNRSRSPIAYVCERTESPGFILRLNLSDREGDVDIRIERQAATATAKTMNPSMFSRAKFAAKRAPVFFLCSPFDNRTLGSFFSKKKAVYGSHGPSR
jgi:hypothetical protein